MQETTYKVSGMHCAACEVLIEKKIIKIPRVKMVDASLGNSQVIIKSKGELSQNELNAMFKEEGYTFNKNENKTSKNEPIHEKSNLLVPILIAGFIGVIFYILQKMGFAGIIRVTSTSSLPSFFAFGLVAGFSSCAALTGGLILSLSKQWLSLYGSTQTFKEKSQPHIMFNIGRLLSYLILGMLLGIIGKKLQLTITFSSILILLVSILMLMIGLNLTGLKYFRKFQPRLPKFITRHIADETKFSGKYMPFVSGALTFFLPCGFTITAQGLALLSGSALQGGLIMFAFALGTAPALLFIGLSSAKLFGSSTFSMRFSQVAGLLLIGFAIFNLNNQLNVLGWKGNGTIIDSSATCPINSTDCETTANGLPPIVNGVQVIKMNASSRGYSPNYFKIKVGTPVRWEITDTGTSGCTNAVLSRALFPDVIDLTPGQTSIKEFTPTKTGKFRFSCWMGMVSGSFEVVE